MDRLARQAVDEVDHAVRARANRAPSASDLERRTRGRRARRRLGVALVVAGVLVAAVTVAVPPRLQPSVLIGGAPSDPDAADHAGAGTLRWWRHDLGAGGVSAGGSFVVANDRAVFAVGGGGYGYVNAARLDDGAEQWRVQVDPSGGVHLQVATGDLVLASAQYERLVALAAEDGARVWTFTAAEDYRFVSSAVADDLLIAVAGTPVERDSRPPLVYALDLASGAQRWVTALREGEMPQCMPPLVAPGAVIVSTMPDGGQQRSAVHVLDVVSGQPRWSTEVGPPLDVTACTEGRLYVTRSNVHVPLPGDGALGAGSVTLDLADGRERWASGARPIAASGQHLLLRDHQRLSTVDPVTGDTLVTGAPVPLADGDLGRSLQTEGQAVTLSGQRLLFVDVATAAVSHHVDLPAAVNEVIVTGDTIIVGSEDRGVLALELP